MLSVPASASYAASATPAPRYEWWLRTLHVARAWGSSDGTGITVAVLSDGIAPRESFLTNSVTQGPDFTNSGRAASSPYYGVMGTAMASLIVGHGNSAYLRQGTQPVNGVAPGAKVLSVRVTLSPGDPLWSDRKVTAQLPDAIAAGIRYAVRHGASVIDLPADPGIRDPAIASGSSAAAGGSPAERSAISYALKSDVLLVAPAGDNGQSGDAANYPAAYPGVMAVGAFGQTFVKAPYSSHQRYVTLTAAGENVVAAGRNGFISINSTCAASAIVTGIAALIRSEFPNLTVPQVISAMTSSTVFRPADGLLDGSGYGTVDAARALASAATMSPPHASPAMAGALPRNHPVTPVVQSAGSVVLHQLSGDAEVAALLLAVLLVPIAMYGASARRRDRREALLAAERAQPGQPASGPGSMLADPLLEFFGPQLSRPAGLPSSVRPQPVPRFQPRPGLTGRSTMSASLTASPARPGAAGEVAVTGVFPVASAHAMTSAAPPMTPPPAQPSAGGVGTSPVVRHVEVSGSPPWEPAREPTTELPWAVVAPQPGATRPSSPDTPAIPPPPDSVWESPPAPRSSAPRSVFNPPVGRGSAGARGNPGVPRPVAAPVPADMTPADMTPADMTPADMTTADMTPADAASASAASASGPEPWPDRPAATPQRPAARRRQPAGRNQDSERGPIFVWSPMGSNDGKQ
jgi:hypothetical protein